MGNSGSQQQQAGHATEIRSAPSDEEQQWSQSFPRSPYKYKLVVPDRDACQRLRPTGNGEILQSGGTISCRNKPLQVVRRSSSGNYSPRPEKRQQQQYSPQQTSKKYQQNHSKSYAPSNRKEQIKRFGSEPDLRGSSKPPQDYYEKYKGRKKYRAPPPPALCKRQSDSEENCDMSIDLPIRRARLFKTRAETKKKISSPVNNRRSISNALEAALLERQRRSNSSEALHLQQERAVNSAQINRHSMPPIQRTRSSPEFQTELKEATKRLKATRLGNPDGSGKSTVESKLQTLDHNLHKKENIRNKLKLGRTKETPVEVRTPGSGKESTPDSLHPKMKTFYFGMNQDDVQKITTSAGSDISGDSETETSTNNISLQLRPILPKKQLEIPRFSPAAAWRLLSIVDAHTLSSTVASEEGSVFQEDRIEKLARSPPPYRANVGPRSNHDKSGDSGISGDETPEAVLPSSRQRGISWTPQQDLEDDSSLGEGSMPELPYANKYYSKPHVFSLSLPRENHLSTYINDKIATEPYSNLQKLKRSVSGILGNKKYNEIAQDPDKNWFLSRSAPNSVNNGFNSLELRKSSKQNDEAEIISFMQPSTRRIMYLPQSNSAEAIKKKHLSKSYENISVESRRLPQNLQDPPQIEQTNKWPRKKPKKFTFQSTMRQIERKRLADKLSREAEQKEQQRLRELEAMQRVEEEFQKKRAREKASIRQQLKLYSMDDGWTSLPPNLEMSLEVRQEPDGAVSSSTPSPTFAKNNPESRTQSTQILSEFRLPQREYKEFPRRSSFSTEQTIVHPRVTCNMSKVKGTTHTGNYRKDFAHGVKSVSSHSEVSSIPRN